jgi:hypothetical protein
METVKCDICRRIKREKQGLLSEKSKWITLSINGRGYWIKYDLCSNCSENLLKYIKRYLNIKKGNK